MSAQRMSARLILVSLALLALLPAASQTASACDTWVALGDATTCGYTILAKNSDRPTFGCQPLVMHPGRTGASARPRPRHPPLQQLRQRDEGTQERHRLGQLRRRQNLADQAAGVRRPQRLLVAYSGSVRHGERGLGLYLAGGRQEAQVWRRPTCPVQSELAAGGQEDRRRQAARMGCPVKGKKK